MNTPLGYVWVLFWIILWFSPLAAGICGVIQLFLRMPLRDRSLAFVGVTFTALSAAGIVWLSVSHLQQYGYALFLGLPVYCGVLPVVIYSHRQSRSYWEAAGIACLTLLVLGLCIIVFALDGLICILMATPLACLMAFSGALTTNAIMRNQHRTRNVIPMLLASRFFRLVGFEARCEICRHQHQLW